MADALCVGYACVGSGEVLELLDPAATVDPSAWLLCSYAPKLISTYPQSAPQREARRVDLGRSRLDLGSISAPVRGDTAHVHHRRSRPSVPRPAFASAEPSRRRHTDASP